MCVTEIWTYGECGCRFNHLVPCVEHSTSNIGSTLSSAEDIVTPPSSTQRKASIPGTSHSTRQSAHLSPLRHTVSSDTESSPDETCDLVFVHKSFLEPICDACVLKEHEEIMALYTEDPISGAGLVWGCEVDIVIDPPDSSKRSSILDPFVRRSVDTGSNDLQVRPLQWKAISMRKQTDTPLSTGGDADDEGSLFGGSPVPLKAPQQLTDVRGRPRSRTKQLRRRALDLSRDDLRISSRWSSGEKKSMENFRDAIQEKAQDHNKEESPFGKWALRAGKPLVKDARTIKDRVARKLRDSVSRSRGQNTTVKPGIRPVTSGEGQSASESSVQKLSQLPQGRSRQVRSSFSLPNRKFPPSSSSDDRAFDSKPAPPTTPESEHSRRQARQSSWQQHLHHDLDTITQQPLRHKKASYLLQEEVEEKKQVEQRNEGRSILPSDYFPDYKYRDRHDSAARPLLQPSSSMSNVSQRDVEHYWRLPSLASSTATHSRLASRSQPHLERLDDIIESGEMDSKFEDSNRSTSFASSSPVSRRDHDIPSPTDDLIAALKARLARSSVEDEQGSAWPILQPSSYTSNDVGSRPFTADADRYYGQLTYSRIASRRIPSSMSLPDGLDVMSRYSSYQYNRDVEEPRNLAIHPLAMRLPRENLIRASIGQKHDDERVK